jgi:hypothetical protein
LKSYESTLAVNGNNTTNNFTRTGLGATGDDFTIELVFSDAINATFANETMAICSKQFVYGLAGVLIGLEGNGFNTNYKSNGS